MSFWKFMWYNWICSGKGHIQIRDWDGPTFTVFGACDRCGQLAFIHWRRPRRLNPFEGG